MGMIYTGSNQRIPEYHSWVCLCAGMGARSYVELGCGSAHFLKKVGVEKVLTVDLLPNGVADVEHIQANSSDPKTLERVVEKLGGFPDVVFIDADHTTEGVRKDFNLWWPVAQMAVGFHDILMPGVFEFWEQICLQYPSVHLVSRDVASAEQWQHGGSHLDGRVNCGGIGIVFKP